MEDVERFGSNRSAVKTLPTVPIFVLNRVYIAPSDEKEHPLDFLAEDTIAKKGLLFMDGQWATRQYRSTKQHNTIQNKRQ
jgi:hypothetical protein